MEDLVGNSQCLNKEEEMFIHRPIPEILCDV